jgi:alpha-tubulin suppressor-like RCC1 family protein
MMATAAAGAAPATRDQNPSQTGHSPIYSFDVMLEGQVVGEVKVDTAKKTPSFVLRAEGLTPGMNYLFWYQGATAEGLYLLGYEGTATSGRLSMNGTFPDASPIDLQAAQFWLMTEPGLVSIEPGYRYLAAGGEHCLALTCHGEVYGWGDNSDAECGVGGYVDSVWVPVLQNLLPGAVEVVCGGQHNLSLMSDGTVYAWGNDANGQLGIHSQQDTWRTPQQVHGPADVGYLTGITRLGAGGAFSLAVKADGSLWAWGRNFYGQLGIHSKDDHTVPYQVHGPGDVGYLTDVVDVAGGDSHSLALKSDGTVWAWGYGGHGQLGIHTKDDHTVPYQVHGPGDVGYLTGIIKVAAGANFSLALKNDGTLWAWGEGGYGQLGIHSDNDHTVPYQVHGRDNVGYLTDVVDVAAGRHHTLAVKSDGTVYAWGGNTYGQLGISSNDGQTVPHQVHGAEYLTGIIEVAAGEYHSLALRDDGTVWAWGYGDYGQLGINTHDDHTIPYQVHGPGNVGYLTEIGPPTDAP